jgi:CubicO group peptidase (beta-lactamase class C family)
MSGGLRRVRELMDRAVAEKIFPGGVVRVEQEGRVVHESAHGRLSLRPPRGPVAPDTVFDLASLTKVLCTASICMRYFQAGRLDLEAPVRSVLPEFSGRGRERVTVRMLLEHSSGLAPWRAYYQEIAAAGRGALLAPARARRMLQGMLLAEAPEAEPGSRARYSDLNFLLLQLILERMSRRPLDRIFHDEVAGPLGIADLFFVPRSRAGARAGRTFAATEDCPWRLRTLAGEVHDDNAWIMGGVAGHAGLFGTGAGVAALAREWTRGWRGERALFARETVRRFFARSRVAGSTRALGFDTPSEQGSQAGSKMPRTAVGHLGFTGTSLWLSPERALCVVLLTNRVHPSRENEQIKKFRPALHDAILEELYGESAT